MTLPEITNLELKLKEQAPVSRDLGITYLFDFAKGDFELRDGKLIPTSGYEALKVWIEKVLRTERFRFKVYERPDGDEYGVFIDDLLGRHYPPEFARAEWQREIAEALTRLPQIVGISNVDFKQTGAEATVSFKVELYSGDSWTQEVRFQ